MENQDGGNTMSAAEHAEPWRMVEKLAAVQRSRSNERTLKEQTNELGDKGNDGAATSIGHAGKEGGTCFDCRVDPFDELEAFLNEEPMAFLEEPQPGAPPKRSIITSCVMA